MRLHACRVVVRGAHGRHGGGAREERRRRGELDPRRGNKLQRADAQIRDRRRRRGGEAEAHGAEKTCHTAATDARQSGDRRTGALSQGQPRHGSVSADYVLLQGYGEDAAE